MVAVALAIKPKDRSPNAARPGPPADGKRRARTRYQPEDVPDASGGNCEASGGTDSTAGAVAAESAGGSAPGNGAVVVACGGADAAAGGGAAVAASCAGAGFAAGLGAGFLAAVFGAGRFVFAVDLGGAFGRGNALKYIQADLGIRVTLRSNRMFAGV